MAAARSHAPVIGDALINGDSGLILVIEKFPSANTLEVTEALDKALSELRLGLPGVEVDANVFRLADYIEASIDNLTLALILGALLVVVALGAFMFEWRSALISFVAIPLSLLAALIVLFISGATLNTMILAGLVVALGAVVDDGIVDVENLRRRLRLRGKDGRNASLASVIFEASLEMRGAIIYATLIVILAVTPIFFMGGLSGAFFGPLAVSYTLALVASMVVALTVTPALSLLLFKNASFEGGESPIVLALQRGYDKMLSRIVQAPRAVFAMAIIAVAAGIGIWPMLGQSLLPKLKEQTLLVNWETPPGTSQAETFRITSRVSNELRSISGVRKVGAHIGRAVTGDQVVGVNSGQLWVGLDPEADYDETIAMVRETVAGYPGIDYNVSTYLRDKVSEVLTGAKQALVVRIYGAERGVLRTKAEEVRKALSDIDGLVDLRAEGQTQEPQVVVRVDLDKASRANITPGDVRRSAATVFSGLEVGFLFEEQKIYNVTVWGTPEKRQSLANIRDLWVEKTDRTHVRLGDVAKVGIKSAPTVIRHEAISPYVDVVANVVGRDLGSVTRDVESRLTKVSFPLEYHPEILGEYAERIDAQDRILGVTIAAVIGIFLLLQACFGSWRLATIGFLALPAALVGGVLAAFAGGGVITLGSLVGLLAVIGIAARNGILLINHYQQLERRDGESFGLALVLRGARERLSPILASTAAIIGALLPMVFLGHVPGLEITQPTAIVILGGLIASTLLTLFVIPALYLSVGSKAERQADLGIG